MSSSKPMARPMAAPGAKLSFRSSATRALQTTQRACKLTHRCDCRRGGKRTRHAIDMRLKQSMRTAPQTDNRGVAVSRLLQRTRMGSSAIKAAENRSCCCCGCCRCGCSCRVGSRLLEQQLNRRLHLLYEAHSSVASRQGSDCSLAEGLCTTASHWTLDAAQPTAQSSRLERTAHQPDGA